MSRRSLILEEMGISPLWRLREAAQSETPGTPAAPMPESKQTETTARAPEPIASATGSAVQPKVQASTEKPDASPALTAADPGEAAARAYRARGPACGDRPQSESTPAAGASIAEPALPSFEAAARRQQILQMDWAALKGSVAQCVACPLHKTRTQTVFGVGDEHAEWMFVGEGPGAEEDAKGEPFVGQAGRLLDSMLAAIDLARGENVYIANVVKCRPPNNRNPEEREMSCCEPYLARQIELIRPQLIIALGRVSANHLLQTDATIASLRGRVHKFRDTPLIVTYHPAYLLRSLQEKAKAWIDLCFARETMNAFRNRAAEP